ncbi:MAG: two-component system response regulator FlrC [Bradymonadia bacterium]|jgi:two-component system response regulator FlrC
MAVAYEIGQLETVHALPTAGEMHEVVFGDPSMARLLALAESVASTPSTVLIHGESGAGKEVVARHIHTHSERASGPFVAINCAALPPSLLESELFGHERGAFSGAVRKHLGVFERAKGGTLLLDEVSEISPEMQAKLLRVLQERVLYRVGGTDPVNLDIRIVATTNRNLKEAIDEGSFRLDLYYRLNVFPLRIDALRARSGDIRPLAKSLLARAAKSLNKSIRGVDEAALLKLDGYGFPGNVRELVNIMERAAILVGTSDVVRVEHIMLDSTETAQDASADMDSADVLIVRPGVEPFDDIRRRVILRTLERCDGNRTRTAEVLGLSLRTIRNRLREYREAGVAVPA